MATATDSFTRANSTGLGANWTDIDGTAGQWFVDTNRAQDSGSGWQAHSYYNALTPGADQYSKATIALNVGTSGLGAGPTCRVQTATSDDGYWVCVNNAAAQEVRLIEVDGGSETVLQTYSSGATPVVGDVFQIEAQGNTLRVLKNGATVITYSPGSLTYGSGRVGIRAVDFNVTVALDDWEGGDLGGGGGPTVSIPVIMHHLMMQGMA